MSFRLKTILGVAFIEAILLIVLIVMGIRFFGATLNDEIGQHVRTTANVFAATVQDAVISSDLASLESFASNVLKNPGITYVRILDEDKDVLTQKSKKENLIWVFKEDRDFEAARGDGVFDISAVIRDGDLVHGRVELGFSVSHLHDLLGSVKRYATGIAVIEMILVALFSFMLGTYLTRQLIQLQKAAEEIKEGRLGYTVEVKGEDEIGKLAQSFNEMSGQVKLLYDEVHDQARRNREIVENISDGIIVFSDDGIIQSVNPVIERLFSCEDSDLIGRNIATLTPSGSCDAINLQVQFIDPVVGKVNLTREMEAVNRDGDLFPIGVSVSEVSVDEGASYFIAVIRDASSVRSDDDLAAQEVA